ncbi:hypothetical protein JD969_11520 [Planctomycetota bacterium]|nr:hypothetical protein JD969_11520 [Planctomycetota bacterium]
MEIMMAEDSNKKTVIAAVVIFIAVLAMFLGVYVALLDEGEPTAEDIAAEQVEAETELERLQNSFSLAMDNRRPAPELIDEIKVYAEAHPESVYAELLYAQSQLYVRNYQVAYDAFERALVLDPNQYQTEMLTGTIAYDHLKNFDGAVKHFELAAALNDKDPQPWLYIAQIKAKQDKPEEAFESLTKAIEIDRNLPQAHASLAELYQQRGMFDAAGREYELALEQSKSSKQQRQHAVYLFKYAKMLAGEGKPEEALPLLADMPLTARTQPEVLVEIGEVWDALGEPSQAAKYFSQVLRADPANEKAAELTVKYYIIAGDKVAAAEAMNDLRMLNPGSEKLQGFADEIAGM